MKHQRAIPIPWNEVAERRQWDAEPQEPDLSRLVPPTEVERTEAFVQGMRDVLMNPPSKKYGVEFVTRSVGPTSSPMDDAA
jgi:hypothetical protein